MKITLLGHASILVETDDIKCLMDPVFGDPFEDGSVTFYPSRKIFLEKLPDIDVIVISHIHLDHFDVASLDMLSRNCDVICPHDKTISNTLRLMEFKKVVELDFFESVFYGSTELCSTASDVLDVVEFGMVFKDKQGTFWNQVDTYPSCESISEINKRFNKIDFGLVKFASQNFDFMEKRTTDFPYKEHEKNLQNVKALMPQMIAPGSAGFGFRAAHEWLNAFLFPISRDRFLSDLKSAAGEKIKLIKMNPGDEVNIENFKCHHGSASSPYAQMVEDNTHLLKYDPTAAIPPLIDPNESELPLTVVKKKVHQFITRDMLNYLNDKDNATDSVVSIYFHCKATYCIEVIYEDDSHLRYYFKFHDKRVSLELDGGEAYFDTDSIHRIAGSALVEWFSLERSFFYVRGYSRRFSSLYARENGESSVKIVRKNTKDLLFYFVKQYVCSLKQQFNDS